MSVSHWPNSATKPKISPERLFCFPSPFRLLPYLGKQLIYVSTGRKKAEAWIATRRSCCCKTFCFCCAGEKGDWVVWTSFGLLYDLQIWLKFVLKASLMSKLQTFLPVKPVTKVEQMRECLRSLKQNHKVNSIVTVYLMKIDSDGFSEKNYPLEILTVMLYRETIG